MLYIISMKEQMQAGIFIPVGRKIWEHERHVADILATTGHYVEFLIEQTIHTPDIRLDHVIEYEIKSPESARAITIERAIKKALKQCNNLIIDSSRMKNARDASVIRFLTAQAKSRKQIKKMLFITKKGEIIDILKLI